MKSFLLFIGFYIYSVFVASLCCVVDFIVRLDCFLKTLSFGCENLMGGCLYSNGWIVFFKHSALVARI